MFSYTVFGCCATVRYRVISCTGIFLGGAIFVLISYGLIEIKANPYFANSFLGALILLAIVLDRVREVLGERKRKA